MKKFRFFGLQRSGNHAIINWITRNLADENHIFLNNCATGDPFATCDAIEVNGEKIIFSSKNQDLRAIYSEKRNSFSTALVSYENVSPRQAIRNRRFTTRFNDQDAWKDLLIIRSFPNWLASHYKCFFIDRRRGEPSLLNSVRLIDQYSSNLGLALNRRVYPIYYDRWYSDPDYRLDVLADQDLENKDNSIGEVAKYGEGSSFSGLQKSAEKMRPSERWQKMSDHADFRFLCKIALSDKTLRSRVQKMSKKDFEILSDLGDHS